MLFAEWQSGATMKRFAGRVVKVWATSGLVAAGAALAFRGIRTPDLDLASWTFGAGVFLLLSAVPLLPWLYVDRWLYAVSYWRRR